jgi:DNA-directed RNA polymerase specialized sigma24 family protein
VQAAIEALPEPQRAVVELVALGRLDTATVARTADLSPAEVVTLLAGAMRTLRPLLRVTGIPGAPSTTPADRASQHVSSEAGA